MRIAIVAIVLSLLTTANAAAQQDWLPSIEVGNTLEVRLDLHASGFSSSFGGVDQILPTKVTTIPDGSGRMVVSTLGGLLRVLDAAGNVVNGAFLNTNTNQTAIAPFAYGLTSVIFHPDYAVAGQPGFGKFYVLVTEAPKPILAYDFVPAIGQKNEHAAILVEYTVDADAIGANQLFAEGGNQNVTRRELLVAQEPDNEHNFSDLAFDSNDLLYITVGDGAFNFNGGINLEALNAPNIGTIYGKVLRIDPLGSDSENGNYGIVPANPFAADADPATLGEIFSLGHRNPWRISIDQPTDRVIVGEVGHFNIEEINVSTAGANYGWPTLEGSFLINFDDGFDLTPDTNDAFANANSLTPPVFEYDHEDGQSVTGGFVYRGRMIPSLVGRYIFGEFQGAGIGARLFAGDLDSGSFEQLLIAGGSAGLGQPVSFGEDGDGELYVVAIDGRILSINPIVLFGDSNLDGNVDLLDIQAFVDILISGFFQQQSDVNQDGVVDILDIQPFVEILINL